MIRIICSKRTSAVHKTGSHAHHSCALCFASKMRHQGLQTAQVLTGRALHCLLRHTQDHSCSGYVGRPIPRAAEQACLAHDICTKYSAHITSDTFRPSRAVEAHSWPHHSLESLPGTGGHLQPWRRMGQAYLVFIPEQHLSTQRLVYPETSKARSAHSFAAFFSCQLAGRGDSAAVAAPRRSAHLLAGSRPGTWTCKGLSSSVGPVCFTLGSTFTV